MWQLAQSIAHSKVDRAEAMHESLQTTIQNLILISSVFLLTGILFLTSTWDGVRIPALLFGMLIVGIIFLLANTLLKRDSLSGLIFWMLGIILTSLIGSWLIQKPEFILLGSILPLIAVITTSNRSGWIIEGVLIGLGWVEIQPAFGGFFSSDLVILTVSLGAFNGLMGWVASREILSMAIWSMSDFDRIRTNLDEVRDRQVELAQVQEDLSLANAELARLSNRLKALEQIAEDARQATTEFVANVSHELRTPLNMIIGYADMISRSPKVYGSRLPPPLMADITAIFRNARHLSSLVNDVLDLSQVEAGRMVISRHWVSIQESIQMALSTVSGLYESKALFLKSEFAADLPLVYIDETRIRQVIINLLSNAGRFTEQGGVILRCDISDGELVIQIVDTGPGISKEDQERVFEPFQQADSSIRRQYGGSGLGLTISKRFIEMHGGKMWLESELHQGTVIYFSLPIKGPPSPDESLTSHSRMRSIIPDDEVGYRVRSRRSQAPALLTPERYIVVDQDQTLQRLLIRYLPDVTIETQPDVSSAILALNQSPAQALVLNLSGADDAQSLPLGRLPYGTPAITCKLPGKREAANRLGVVEYLIKPLSRDNILASVEKLGARVKTILIVDDEEDELHLFARYLETTDRRYSILQVTNGQRALSMLRSRRPDVMLLDLNMPGIDGFQVLEEKHQDPAIRDIPVIIVSSRDPAGDPIISNSFVVSQSGGLSQHNLIDCIQALGKILAPSASQSPEK